MTWIDETIEEGNAALFSGDIDEMEAFLKNATKRMAFEGVPEPKRGLNFFKYQATFLDLATVIALLLRNQMKKTQKTIYIKYLRS